MTETQNDEQGWLRVELLTTRGDLDAGRLFDLGALGVETQDAETFMDDAPFAPVPEGKSRLIAYFDADRAPEELQDHLSQRLHDVEFVSVADYNDRSWETAWMKFFQPTQISPRVAVGPPWDPPPAPPGGLAITIEPGMAFGTGTHETTRLCARLLDELLDGQKTLLDVGCGSAILSMVAAGLGVEKVLGIDIDATAVGVARENIEKNGFTPEQIELSTTPLAELATRGDRFDLVVANILAPILIALRPGLLATVAPGGSLLLSGIPEIQLEEVRTAFTEPGFEEQDTRIDGEWAALFLRRVST